MNLILTNFLEYKVLKKLKFSFIILTIFLSIFQLFIISNDFKIFQVLSIIIFSTIIVSNLFFNEERLKFFLIPSLILFAANLFYFFFPLLFKTILYQEINSNLFLNEKAFYFAFLYIMAISLALKSINILYNSYFEKEKLFLTKLNLFKIPTINSVIKFFIIIVLLKIYLAIFDQGLSSTTQYGDKLMKFIYGFEKFYYLPLIFFFIYFFENIISKKKLFIFILIYLIISIFFAVLKNSRTEIFETLVIMSSICFIFFLYKKIHISRKVIVLSIILISIFSILLNFISNKILDTRSLRNNVTSLELLEFYNSSYTEDNQVNEIQDALSPNYTNNNLINRFTPISYLDLMLYAGNFFTIVDIENFRNFSFQRILGILPQNLTNIFIKDYKKSNFAIANGSYTERVAFKKFGGDFNKGSLVAEVFIITQSYFFSFLFIYMLFFFLFLVCVQFQKLSKNRLILSPLILLSIFDYIYISQVDNSLSILSLIIRAPIQLILLYFLIQKTVLKYEIK